MPKPERDVEKVYSAEEMAQKLRRFADSLESGEAFRISIAGEAIRVPKGAEWSVEHERDGDSEEIEFQIRWNGSDA